MKEYICKNCKDVWNYYEEDMDCPTICPLCEMPIIDVFKDISAEEGRIAAIKFIIKNRI